MIITKETIQKLKEIGLEILAYNSSNMDTVPVEQADSGTIYYTDTLCMFAFKALKKEMTFKWFVDFVAKKEGYQSINWYKIFEPLQLKNVEYYITCYGVGVEVIFGDRENTIQKLRDFLTKHNIEFTNEYSDAHWVYRFKIGKSKENIDRIKNLEL